jgi:hypothetical protein
VQSLHKKNATLKDTLKKKAARDANVEESFKQMQRDWNKK